MKIYYLSPLFFKHGGVYLKMWEKSYRLIKVGEH